MSKIIDLDERCRRMDAANWDNEARRAGFKDFASLAAVEDAAFSEAYEQAEKACTHPKYQNYGMCESCLQGLTW